MHPLQLTILSLAYSSWSMRPWLALTHAEIDFTTHTVELPEMQRPELQLQEGAEIQATPFAARQKLGSVSGLFPVLLVGDTRIHESLAICEYAAENHAPKLWPTQPLARAQARAVSCEMLGGFTNLRSEMPCHLFGRVPNFQPSAGTERDLARIYSLWRECLARSGGPYLFGDFSIADAMYFPVLSRLWTYGIDLPDDLTAYANSIESVPAVQQLMATAAQAPAVPIYDAYLRGLGGIPQPT
jgi:glutathione S-transferase